MFKLYDHECKLCGHVFERLADPNSIVYCEKCGGYTKRIISMRGVNTSNQDAPWIRSVTEVVDKEGGAHCQQFLKDPTRDNLKNWMKVEGVRHYEPGERIKPPPVDTAKIEKEVFEKFRARERMVI
jgi:putative FmdB family regulatory protein